MPLELLKYGISRKYPARVMLPPQPDLKQYYDVVIIGAGGHGLAAAYYLAKDWGISDVVVLDKGYLGGGNTSRNTAIIRANYLTPEGERFYKESLGLWQRLSDELRINLLYSERGQIILTHSESGIRTMRLRAKVNKFLGVDSEFIYPDDIARLVPCLNLSEEVRAPILGALYHPPGATARHDAVAWGYAAGAAERGVELQMRTEVLDVIKDQGRAVGVITDRGAIRCDKVLQAVAGSSSVVAKMAGFRLPLHTIPLQACITEPLKPIFDPILSSDLMHVYAWQTSRGEVVIGGALNPYPLYSNRSTFDFLETLAGHTIELLPFLSEAAVLRQWAGICDVTPDASPILGKTPLENYYIDSGTGTWGFKATPVCGKRMAETIATGRVPELLRPFALDRFAGFRQVGEGGASTVGH